MNHSRLEFPRIFPTELHTLKIDSLKKKCFLQMEWHIFSPFFLLLFGGQPLDKRSFQGKDVKNKIAEHRPSFLEIHGSKTPFCYWWKIQVILRQNPEIQSIHDTPPEV